MFFFSLVVLVLVELATTLTNVFSNCNQTSFACGISKKKKLITYRIIFRIDFFPLVALVSVPKDPKDQFGFHFFSFPSIHCSGNFELKYAIPMYLD